MSWQPGRIAKYKRALKRPNTRGERTRELLGGEAAFSTDVKGLPPEVRQRLDSAKTDTLFDLLKEQDARVGANRELVGYAVQVLAGRLGSLDALHDRGLGWATDLERDGDQEEGSHVFAGWIEDAGKVRWVENWFHPDRPQDVAPEMVERFRKLDGCGGVLARLDDAAALSRVEDVRHTASKWRGRPLQSLGPVAADRLARALGPVASYELETLLDEEGSASCMLALEGRRVVALGSQGDVYRFNQKETKHLARVGLLPRHWYLPMQWWKKKKEEEKQEEDERKGKVRVYKGRYDDEDEIGHEEKEEYGE